MNKLPIRRPHPSQTRKSHFCQAAFHATVHQRLAPPPLKRRQILVRNGSDSSSVREQLVKIPPSHGGNFSERCCDPNRRPHPTDRNGNTSFSHHMLESVFLKVKPYDSVPPVFSCNITGGWGVRGAGRCRRQNRPRLTQLKVEAAEVSRKSLVSAPVAAVTLRSRCDLRTRPPPPPAATGLCLQH